jgi:acyl dehydratase
MTAIAVGAELPTLNIPPISRSTLALFAGASGDINPIHLDHELAAAAGMGDVFAQGMLSMAYLGRLLTDLFPQDRIRSYGVRFAAITPVKGAPTCTATVTSIDEVDGEPRATLALTVALADGTTTLTGDAVVALETSGESA